jgi:hypothetical protein
LAASFSSGSFPKRDAKCHDGIFDKVMILGLRGQVINVVFILNVAV